MRYGNGNEKSVPLSLPYGNGISRPFNSFIHNSVLKIFQTLYVSASKVGVIFVDHHTLLCCLVVVRNSENNELRVSLTNLLVSIG